MALSPAPAASHVEHDSNETAVSPDASHSNVIETSNSRSSNSNTEKMSTPTAVLLDIAPLDHFLLSLLLPSIMDLVPHMTGAIEDLVRLLGGRMPELAVEIQRSSVSVPSSAWLMAILQCVTILATQGQTPAVQLLGMKWEPIPSKISNGNLEPHYANSSWRWRLGCYAILSSIVPVAYEQLDTWWKQRQEQRRLQSARTSLSHPTMPFNHAHGSSEFAWDLAAERQERVLRLLFQTVNSILPMVRLAILLQCWSGKSSSPSLAMLVTQTRYTPVRSNRITTSSEPSSSMKPPLLHVDYAHRRWLYEELVQTLRILLAGWAVAPQVWWPLVQEYVLSPLHSLQRRVVQRVMHPASGRTASTSDSAMMCPICRTKDMAIPMETNCGHIYCYVCLYKASSRGGSSNSSPFYCRECRQPVTSAQRWKAPSRPTAPTSPA